MAKLDTDKRSHEMGLHEEQLAGRTQQVFFEPDRDDVERFTYPDSYPVDFDKATEFDAAEIDPTEVNRRIRRLMAEG